MYFRLFLLLIISFNIAFGLNKTYYEITPDKKTLVVLDKDGTAYLSTLKKGGDFMEFDNGRYEIKDGVLSLEFKDLNDTYQKKFRVEKSKILPINDKNISMGKPFKLADINYYKNYLGKYENSYGTAILQQSGEYSLSFEFYPKLANKECEISSDIGISKGLVIGDDLVINSIDESTIYIKSRICTKSLGLFKGDKNHEYTITKHSLGLLHKDVKIAELTKKLPEILDSNDSITVMSLKNVKLFSIKKGSDTPKNIEILNDIYKTPNGIGLGSSYGEVKKALFIDSKVTIESKTILKNNFLNLTMEFDSADITKNGNKAKIKALKLEW